MYGLYATHKAASIYSNQMVDQASALIYQLHLNYPMELLLQGKGCRYNIFPQERILKEYFEKILADIHAYI